MGKAMHDRLIARLPVKERRGMLEAVVASSHGHPVLIEYGHDRKVEGATSILARLVGVAFAPGGLVTDVLVVKPAATSRRHLALSAAHVLRISAATQLDRPDDPENPLYDDAMIPYRLGEVIAGPPRGEVRD
jgi:hypothetical protein